MSEQWSKWYTGLKHSALVRSGTVTITLIIVALLTIAIGWHEHIRGQFGRLKRELKGPVPATAPALPPPGGQEPITLQRSTIEGGTQPEFLSAVFLPGRGMNLFQLKAYLPGRGEVDLLSSPSLAETSEKMKGTGEDSSGAESLRLGGAIEVPWAGNIYGPASGGTIAASWNGQTLRLPTLKGAIVPVTSGGLLLRMPATSTKTNIMPDGGEVETMYDAGDFGGHWPSRMQITTTAQLSGHVLELKVTARNNGSAISPVGIGWSPRFELLHRTPDGMTLHVPSVTRIERNGRGEPTGRLVSVERTSYDFSGRPGGAFGELDETYVDLRQAPLDNGPVVELRDAANNYGLRLTLLSTSIKAVRVASPPGAHYIVISPQFNLNNPFGREWDHAGTDPGMVILQPGQTAQWRVRLEIFSLATPSPF